MQLPELFHSEQEFRACFINGLSDMMSHEELGVFILVLANATFDPQVYSLLQHRLEERFELLKHRYEPLFQAGAEIDAAPDDVAVFRRLLDTGFNNLRVTEFRQEQDWEIQFNQLRSFRPARMSQTKINSVCAEFDENGFHFNKPFLQKEIFWQGEIKGYSIRLLYNKFPFVPLHSILVIDSEQNKPQVLDESSFGFVWALLASLEKTIKEVGIGYNSCGAYSSVNHQHFQMMVSAHPFAVERKHWSHNGGTDDYPLDCRVYTEPDRAWQVILQHHQDNLPYNLFFRPGKIYVISRRMQSDYQHSDWTSGFAWAEVCGAIMTARYEDFERLDATSLGGEMRLLNNNLA